MIVVTRQTLLEFRDIEKVVSPNSPTQLTNERNVLGDVATESSELWIFFHEALHVVNAVQLLAGSLLGSKLLDVVFRILPKVAEVLVHVLYEEGILILRYDNFLVLI